MGFPVQIDTQPYRNSEEWLIKKEGMPYHWGARYNNTPTNGTSVLGLWGNFVKSKILVNLKSSVYSNKDATLYMSSDADYSAVYATHVDYFEIPAGAVIPMSFDTPLDSSNSGLNILNPDGTAYRLGCFSSGTIITNDLNFGAKRKIFWIGDSIADNASVNTSVTLDQYYQWIVRDTLIANSAASGQNYDARLVIKAIGGKTGVDFDKLLKANRLFVDNPHIIFYQHGVNDSSQSVGTTAYTTALNSFMNHKKRYYPNAWLVMLGATPLQNSTSEATLATYRTAMQNAVTTMSDGKIKYITLEKAFDRTVSARYATSDGAGGSAVHPGDATALAGIANCILTGLQYDGTYTNGLSTYGITL